MIRLIKGFKNVRLRKIFLLAAILLTQVACSSKCNKGCLITQGKELSFKQADQLVHDCNDFTYMGLGKVVIKSSHGEIYKKTNGKFGHPLMNAFLAYQDLYDSPLIFYRSKIAEDNDYYEILRSCNQLKRDFYGDKKWVDLLPKYGQNNEKYRSVYKTLFPMNETTQPDYGTLVEVTNSPSN